MTAERWTKLLRGDHLTDEEVDQMTSEAEAAIPYLQARGERFHHAWLDTHMNLTELRRIKGVRAAEHQARHGGQA